MDFGLELLGRVYEAEIANTLSPMSSYHRFLPHASADESEYRSIEDNGLAFLQEPNIPDLRDYQSANLQASAIYYSLITIALCRELANAERYSCMMDWARQFLLKRSVQIGCTW
jgi:hypothetical protein